MAPVGPPPVTTRPLYGPDAPTDPVQHPAARGLSIVAAAQAARYAQQAGMPVPNQSFDLTPAEQEDQFFRRMRSLPKPELKAKLDKLTPDQKLAFAQKYQTWNQNRALSPEEFQAATGMEKPSVSPLRNIPMSYGRFEDATPKPGYEFVNTDSGLKLTFAGHSFQYEKDINLFGMRVNGHVADALMIPRWLHDVSEVKRELIDPLVQQGQSMLADQFDQVSSVKRKDAVAAHMSLLTAAGMDPDKAKAAANAFDYLRRAGSQWVFGKAAFEGLSDDEHLQAINDLESIANSPLGIMASLPLRAGLGVHPSTMAAGASSLATEAGQLPMYLLGPGKFLTQAAEAAPIAGGALAGAVMGAGMSVVQPGQSLEEASYGGAAFGGTIGSAAGNPLGLEGQMLSVSRQPLAQAVLAGVADDPATKGAALEVARSMDFIPSVVLQGKNEARAYRLFADGSRAPEVMRIPIRSVKGLQYLDAYLEQHGVEAIPLADGVDRFGPQAAQYAKKTAAPVTSTDGTVGGATRRRANGPIITDHQADGTVELYRLTSEKARYRALQTPPGSDIPRVAEVMTPDGPKRGFLLAYGDELFLSPGDDHSHLPGFVDQVINTGDMKVRGLKDAELRELAKHEPEAIANERARLDPGTASYGDLLSSAAEWVDSLPAERKQHIGSYWDDVRVEQPKRLPPLKGGPAELPPMESEVRRVPALGSDQRGDIRGLFKRQFGISDELAGLVLADLGSARSTGRINRNPRAQAYAEALFDAYTKGQTAKIGPPKPLPDVLPRATEPTFTMGNPRTPDQAQASALYRDLDADHPTHVMLNSGQAVEVKSWSESMQSLTYRNPDGTLTTVPATEVAGAIDAPIKTTDKYYADPTMVAGDLANAKRSFGNDPEMLKTVQGDILKQARGDGIAEDMLQHSMKTADAMADSGAKLDVPSYGLPPPPPRDPPIAPPGSPPAPSNPRHIIPEDVGTLKAAAKDPNFIERFMNTVFGPRSTATPDVGQYINMAYSIRGMEQHTEAVEKSLQRLFGQKHLSDFDTDLFKVFERQTNEAGKQLTMDDLRAKYPNILSPEIDATVQVAMAQRDANQAKLQAMGLFTDKFTDDQARAYVTHLYARYFLPKGEWAKIASRNEDLMKRGTDMMERFELADGTAPADAREAASRRLQDLIGHFDKDAKDALVRSNSPRGNSLGSTKNRTLDELEAAVTMGDPKTKGMTPADVSLIRELLGQPQSGIHAIANTITRQKVLINRHSLFNEMNALYPSFFSSTGRTNWLQLSSDRMRYGDLAGKYVRPDIHEAIFDLPERMTEASNFIQKMTQHASSWVKGNETALNLGTWNTNFFGNAQYAMLAGGMDIFGHRMPHFGEAIKLMHGAWKNPFGVEARMMDDMRRLGVEAAGFGATEISPFSHNFQRELANKVAGGMELDGLGVAKLTYDILRKPAQVAGAGLDITDRAWRHGSYLALLEKGGLDWKTGAVVDQAKAASFLSREPQVKAYNAQRPPFTRTELPPLHPDDLAEMIKRKAAFDITSSFPMPDKVSPLIDSARKNIGWFAKYLTYKSEAARIYSTAVIRMARGDVGLLGRSLATLGLGTAMATANGSLRRANGISDEDVSAAMDSMPGKKYRTLPFAAPWRDSHGRVQILDPSKYFDFLPYVTQDLAFGQKASMLLKNSASSIFDGSNTDTLIHSYLYRAGITDDAPQRLREDQRDGAAALDYGWRQWGLLPKVGVASYDAWKKSRDPSLPNQEQLTLPQAVTNFIGFPNMPVGDASYVRMQQQRQAQMLQLAKDQRSAVRTPAGAPMGGPVQQAMSGGAGYDPKAAAMKDAAARQQVGGQIQTSAAIKQRATPTNTITGKPVNPPQGNKP